MVDFAYYVIWSIEFHSNHLLPTLIENPLGYIVHTVYDVVFT